jgi:adenosylhomocysteine nucleosidase
MSLLIVFPMPIERDAFLKSCTALGHSIENIQIGKLSVTRLPSLALTLAVGGTGKAQFALQTQHLLDTGEAWDGVICAGAAGAFADDLAVGDVVLGTATLEHDYNNKFTQRLMPRFEADPHLLGRFQKTAPHGFQIHAGIIASGDEDVVDDQRRQALQSLTGAIAVAWEGAGGARACRFSGVPFLEIRGITDSAGHSAPTDFEENLIIALHNLAITVLASL